MSGVMGEIEKVRGPLASLIRRIEGTGKHHEMGEWQQCRYCLYDALERLDEAQGVADTGRLDLED